MSKDNFMLVTQIKKKQETKQAHVKCSAEILKLLQEKADLYADGNLSEWLRYAGLNFVPSKADLAPVKKQKK